MVSDGVKLICREQRSHCQAATGVMPRLPGFLRLWPAACPSLLLLLAFPCSRDGLPGPLTSEHSGHDILTWFTIVLVTT